MPRRPLTLALTIFALLTSLSACAADAPATKPDIVFILADDLGYADVGFNGGKEIKTPHLDALAARGAVLNQFYVQPVCSPTRACLMTGRYPMRYGLQVGVIRPWAAYGLPLEERTLPQGLRDAGYSTRMVGKWHLGSFDKAYFPTARGFEHFYGHLFGALDYFTHIRDGKLDWYRDGEPLKEEGYTTHLMAREAAKIVTDQPKDKPLFLYVAFNAVHAPHQVPEKYTEPYANLKGVRKTYAGMLAAMDEGVGQIVAAVDKAGRRDRTLFLFSSDNGGPAPGRVTDNGPFRAGKGTLYEGGVRVCAFATWDAHIKPGSKVDQPIHMVDWYPTLLNLVGQKVDQKLPLDGLDVWPTITQGKPSPHEWILHNAEPNRGAIRAGDWKLVLGGGQPSRADDDDGPPDAKPDAGAAKPQPGAAEPQSGPAAAAADAAPRPAPGPRAGQGARAARRAAAPGRVELFNIREDPYEKTDLADKHPDKVNELRARYDAAAKQAAPPRNVRGAPQP